ncbi:MAG: hypothetical protein COW88_00455, partial [Candidatus Lloydbacteria bacterium CG22_combo_CG10-13_8_21_14_all_47_15]
MTACRVLVGMLIFFLVPIVSQAGFGVSPPSIKESSLVAGSHLTKTIYLVQSEPDKPLDMVVLVDSKDISEWISFEKGTAFTIPAGVQQYAFPITIQVPKDADLGVYQAYVRMNTAPKSADADGGSGVSITAGGLVSIDITVGDNVVKVFRIAGLKIRDIRSGQKPTVDVTIANTGNVPAGPRAASFELFNKFGNVRLGYAETEDIEEVPSFSEETVRLKFPIGFRLTPGDYWGYVKVYGETNKVMQELKTVFNVGEPIGFAALIAAVGGIGGSIALGVGAVVLVFALAIFFIRFRKR